MNNKNIIHRTIKSALGSGSGITKLVPRGIKSAVRDRLYEKAVESVISARNIPAKRESFPDGVNLVGQIKGEFGLGESARLLYNELNLSGIKNCVYNYSVSRTASENDESFDGETSDLCPYNINLLHINPDSCPEGCYRLGAEKLAGRYNIGFWLWEQEEFPEKWKKHFRIFDEIWTPSEFISRTVRRETKLPVITVPYGIGEAENEGFSRKDFSLPESVFLVLMMYDGASESERKNPEGAIKAYKRAFSPGDKNVGIVIKTMNSSEEELLRLKGMLKGYENVFIICDCLPKNKLNALIRLSDVFLSLHRAEGFGLCMAEAMQRGTAVVATDWSANTEFMNDSTAFMVKAEMTELTQNYGPYLKGTHWAQPDIDDAAGGLLRLYRDKEFYDEITKAAEIYIKEKLDPELQAKIIRERIEKIYLSWK